MTAIPGEFIDNAVAFIGGEFPDWTVEKYRGNLDLDEIDVPGYPYVSVAFEGAEYDPENDFGAGRFNMTGRLVCYLVQKHESASSFTDGFNASCGLMSYILRRSFHDAAQQAVPRLITPVPETLPNGQPHAGRSVWSVEADAVLLIEETGGITAKEFHGLPDEYRLGEPMNKVNLTVRAVAAPPPEAANA